MVDGVPSDPLEGYVLAFRPGVTLRAETSGDVVLEAPPRRLTLRDPAPGLLDALRALTAGGATSAALSDDVLVTAGPAALAHLYYCLQRLARAGWLQATAVDGSGAPLLTLVPTAASFDLRPIPPPGDLRFVLSRFACLRRDGDRLVLETPLAPARVVFHDDTGFALLAGLSRPRRLDELGAELRRVPPEALAPALALLVAARAVTPVEPDGTPHEDASQTLAQWEFHDLLFHARSRAGRHDQPFGATHRFLDTIPPLPAVRPDPAGVAPDDLIDLYRPDVAALAAGDRPFTAVLEGRRSIRRHGDPPITARQLGEFLYRTARVKTLVPADRSRGALYDATTRPYPGGGACYELELYLAVSRCDGIPPGLYHYDPLRHRLRRISGPTPATQTLLRAAALACLQPDDPQILIAITARFQRVSWSYAGMAYAVVLKDVGALLQTMYLVATALDLAPCAVGGGNADLLADATAADYFAESSVGEFVLGTRRD